MLEKSHKAETAITEGCLSDDQLYRYIEKLVTEEERQKIHLHLNSCARCFDEVVTLARNTHLPASEAEKLEITRLRKLTPQAQVDRILDYVKARESVWAKFLREIKKLPELIKFHISALLSSFFAERDPVWKYLFAGAVLLVFAAGSFWGIQYYKKGYRIIRAERLLNENYQVSVPDREPRLSGDFAPTGLGTLLGPAEKKRPYIAQAFKLAEDAIASGYNDPKAKQLLARIYILNGQYAQADSILQQLKFGSQTLAAALNDLGVIHFKKKDWETAGQFFAEAILSDPTINEARYNLALTRVEMGDAAGAIAILEDYIKLETAGGWKDVARRLKRELQ